MVTHENLVVKLLLALVLYLIQKLVFPDKHLIKEKGNIRDPFWSCLASLHMQDIHLIPLSFILK